MSLEEEIEKCGKIHDNVAEHWNWAYYDTPHGDSSWLVGEYVKKLKPDIERRVPAMIQELGKILAEHSNDTFSLLDVGCGVGGFIHAVISSISEKYPNIKFRASGIDISSEMIEYASKNLRDLDAELVCDSITNSYVKFKNEPFDVAIMMVTLSFYNAENAKDLLRAVRSKLNRDGYFLLMDFAWSYRWGGRALFSKPLQKLTDMLFSHILGEPFHFTNRTEDELSTLLNDAGFEVLESFLTEQKSKMKGMLVIKARPKNE